MYDRRYMAMSKWRPAWGRGDNEPCSVYCLHQLVEQRVGVVCSPAFIPIHGPFLVGQIKQGHAGISPQLSAEAISEGGAQTIKTISKEILKITGHNAVRRVE